MNGMTSLRVFGDNGHDIIGYIILSNCCCMGLARNLKPCHCMLSAGFPLKKKKFMPLFRI